MEKVGIIGFAFGQQKKYEAGPSNEQIAIVARYVLSEEENEGAEVFLSEQWEVAVYSTEELSLPPDFWVSTFRDSETHYINTKGVLDRSLEYFQSEGVTRVIMIAHPFHLVFIRLLIAARLWKVEGVRLDWSYVKELSYIPYDKSAGNVQWWTRGPFVFTAYLFKTLLTKKHGN